MNICKRQTFIGKKYLTFKKKYLRILFHIASCIYEAYSCLYFPEKGCHLGTNRSDNET